MRIIDTIPQLKQVKGTRAVFGTTTNTWSDADITWSDSTAIWGGGDSVMGDFPTVGKIDDAFPKMSKIEDRIPK